MGGGGGGFGGGRLGESEGQAMGGDANAAAESLTLEFETQQANGSVRVLGRGLAAEEGRNVNVMEMIPATESPAEAVLPRRRGAARSVGAGGSGGAAGLSSAAVFIDRRHCR
ncbi:MAG UNVERIFIED_CONTAM: hypothetical protein LVR18_43185 [Planctomycetaceae bacterium]|jgi:hypothetical protein